jgi:hypothetical protein
MDNNIRIFLKKYMDNKELIGIEEIRKYEEKIEKIKSLKRKEMLYAIYKDLVQLLGSVNFVLNKTDENKIKNRVK